MLKMERRTTDDAWRRAHFQLISAILYRSDPLRRIASRSDEEYDTEARHIIKALNPDSSISEVETLVQEAFLRDHRDAAGRKADYRVISIEVFRLLKKFGGQSESTDMS